MENLNQILREGKIIDNKRVKSLNMKEALKILAKDSEGFKCAVGYFYLEGLIEIISSLKELKEIKILMGYETTKPTKEELTKVFKNKFNELEDNEQIRPAIALFYKLVKEYNTLKIRVYFGDNKNPERLHSKAYLFLRDNSTNDYINRYKAGIIGSSNLTPSGLVGNTELNTIITEKTDLNDVEVWFDNLWNKGTEDFDKLKISDAILKAIENSKFKKDLENAILYIEPKEFFRILIKFLNADYLFEDFKNSKLLQFQYVDFRRVLNNFNTKKYRGCFLTSSVGLGKSYVASQVAKYYIENRKKVLVIAPAGLIHNKDQWPRYLHEFGISDKVKLVSMGDLQKKSELFNIEKHIKNYGLIIVDEAHNYRNPDSYRTRNLKKIIDENGNSKVLFLTATPINTNLNDLLNLVKLFHRKGQNLLFDKLVRELDDIINLFRIKEWEELKDSEKINLSKTQEEIEKEMFVKSTRETIKTSKDYISELKIFTGVDIRGIPDPNVEEIKYELDSNYKNIVSGIVDFINSLSAAHLRLLDPERGIRLSGFFKWVLYKRFESDISAYYLTLKRLSKRNTMILNAIEKQDIKYLNFEEYEDDVDIDFDPELKNKFKDVIEKIKYNRDNIYTKILDDLKLDVEKINYQVQQLMPFLELNNKILFKNDRKIELLNKILKENKNKKILIFTEYKDTLSAIKEYLKNNINTNIIKFVDSNTKNKQTIIEKFNDKNNELRILISTDTLSEGFNISGADIVINFDIPYNPVRIIQRIGRATRLDNPKNIKVLNFRPDESLDVELKLVETMELRIKDIIRFIGVEYRIWFEAEKELLKERRERDKKIYLEVFNKIRNNMRSGNFSELETSLDYSEPILIFLQKSIKQYNIKKEELNGIKIPEGKYYTLLKGNKSISVIYNGEIYNDEILINKNITQINQTILFENVFKQELKIFDDYLNKIRINSMHLQYFNDSRDKMINSIIDYINLERLVELYPNITELEQTLRLSKLQCGATTSNIIKKIKSEIKQNINKNKIIDFIKELKESFTKYNVQKKLTLPKESYFFIAFNEE